jgi:hypothetical protein
MARNAYYKTEHWLALRKAALVRDRHTCIVPGCNAKGTHVDHIRTRPNVDTPSVFDTITNVRTLCAHHDAQVKELPSGKRRRDGKPIIKGCDANGWPLDPSRR